MSILRTVILAALCGIAMGGGVSRVSVDLKKADVTNKPNTYFDPWILTLTEGNPNTLRLLFTAKMDVPENMKLKFVTNLGGKDFPPAEMTLCQGMVEETVGKPTMAQGREPFPKSCPIKKGTYEIVRYSVNTEKFPPGLPPGKFITTTNILMPGEEPFVTTRIEGEIKSNLFG